MFQKKKSIQNKFTGFIPVMVECINDDSEENYCFPTFRQAERCFHSVTATYKQIYIEGKEGDILLASERYENGQYEKKIFEEEIQKRLLYEQTKGERHEK